MLVRPDRLNQDIKNESLPFPTVIPFARSVLSGHIPRGLFSRDRPMGIVLHYLADRNVQRAYRSLKQSGLGYHLVIDRDGAIDQLCPLNMKIYHAGEAEWRGYNCNGSFIGIALASWGLLSVDSAGTLRAWTGAAVEDRNFPEDDVVYRFGNLEYPKPQFWDAVTADQENALRGLLKFLVSNGINPKNLCGHDEAAIPLGRKTDPGGVLRSTMKELRIEFGVEYWLDNIVTTY